MIITLLKSVLFQGARRLGLAIHVWPPTSDSHNFFVRTPFWVFLDSMKIPLSLESIHIYLDEIGMILNSS